MEATAQQSCTAFCVNALSLCRHRRLHALCESERAGPCDLHDPDILQHLEKESYSLRRIAELNRHHAVREIYDRRSHELTDLDQILTI